MIEIREYLDENENSPFADWFNRLNVQAALKVNTYLTRIENGNFSTVKGVGGGVHECRIDWGPGYRVYLCKDGKRLIILLGGGTKKRQQADIEDAQTRWKKYKKEKRSVRHG
jgi:putative addiction module killer protein